METFREEDERQPRERIGRHRGLHKELKDIKRALKIAGYYKSEKERKPFKLPNKWNSQIKKSQKKKAEDQILVLYLSAKQEIIPPFLTPVVGGNVIVYRNKAHEFDSSDLWTMRVGNKIAKVYVVREIDRKPVSNKDWAEVKERGDSTRDDEVLLKMLKLATIEKMKKQVSKGILWIIGIALAVGILAYVIFA